jgi:hypothetical protein
MPTLTQVCRGFTVDQWSRLRPNLDADEASAWRIAVDVFERRLRERYLSSIDALIDADSGASADVKVVSNAPADGSTLPAESAVVPGFAIVALTCLLIETLQSFIVGASPKTQDQFQAFLKRKSFGGAFTDVAIASSFVKGVRHGIFHEGETRNWLLWRSEPESGLVEALGNGRYALNRTAFYAVVRQEFEDYCAVLRNGDVGLRKPFRKQMDAMIGKC